MPDADQPTVIVITPLEAEAVRTAVEAVQCPFPLFAAGSPFAFAPTQAVPSPGGQPCTTTTPTARAASKPAG